MELIQRGNVERFFFLEPLILNRCYSTNLLTYWGLLDDLVALGILTTPIAEDALII